MTNNGIPAYLCWNGKSVFKESFNIDFHSLFDILYGFFFSLPLGNTTLEGRSISYVARFMTFFNDDCIFHICPCWLGKKDSNLRSRIQSPPSYR